MNATFRIWTDHPARFHFVELSSALELFGHLMALDRWIDRIDVRRPPDGGHKHCCAAFTQPRSGTWDLANFDPARHLLPPDNPVPFELFAEDFKGPVSDSDAPSGARD